MEKSTHSPGYRALRAELRRMREAAALSQRDLAARLNVPHSWVAKVESGERRIDVVEFCWLASACSASPLATLEKLLPQIARRSARSARGGREK